MPADLYVAARMREGRLLPDEMVATLPHVPGAHGQHDEWRLRADSSARLVALLRAQRRPLRILELGCGNGWLANRLAAVPGATVTGTDVNDVELDQARRVFAATANLDFLHHDMRERELPVPRPDVIVCASALQYVPDPARLVAQWLGALAPGGEIHVLDTPLYTSDSVIAARERTRRHYASIGVAEMAELYHHHTWSCFDGFDVEVLHDPATTRSRLQRRLLHARRSPFPWIRISRDAAA
jgi:SAM-dependent methyltransferase